MLSANGDEYAILTCVGYARTIVNRTPNINMITLRRCVADSITAKENTQKSWPQLWLSPLDLVSRTLKDQDACGNFLWRVQTRVPRESPLRPCTKVASTWPSCASAMVVYTVEGRLAAFGRKPSRTWRPTRDVRSSLLHKWGTLATLPLGLSSLRRGFGSTRPASVKPT